MTHNKHNAGNIMLNVPAHVHRTGGLATLEGTQNLPNTSQSLIVTAKTC